MTKTCDDFRRGQWVRYFSSRTPLSDQQNQCGPITGISRRGAYVEMRTAADAQKAINGLNFADFDGRLMSVYKAVAAGIAH